LSQRGGRRLHDARKKISSAQPRKSKGCLR